MKDLESTIYRKFGVGQKHFVPHITLAGGFKTSKENNLIDDFKSLCEEAPKMTFKMKGFSTFEEPNRVVFFDIDPSEELRTFRWNLSQKIRNYCSLKNFDFHDKEEFIFHSTLSLNVPPEKFQRIKHYINKIPISPEEHYVVRATLLKNNQIFREYDFFQKKLLYRNQARDPEFYSLTQALLDEHLKNNPPVPSRDIKKDADQAVKRYLISDLHLDHENIIRYCNRNFKNKDEMNNALLDCWNSVVRDSDIVYFLGDLRYGKNSHSIEFWLKKLKGNIIFIKGSHDNEMENIQHFETHFINYRDKWFLLIHDPDEVPSEWDGWVIHGHHHNNKLHDYPFINGEKRTINVSTELIGYHPLDIEQLFALNFEKIKYMRDLKSAPEYFPDPVN